MKGSLSVSEGINRPWPVETNGINKIPDRLRTGSVRDLFWIWFAANIGILVWCMVL
jgi:hypothetical protein